MNTCTITFKIPKTVNPIEHTSTMFMLLGKYKFIKNSFRIEGNKLHIYVKAERNEINKLDNDWLLRAIDIHKKIKLC